MKTRSYLTFFTVLTAMTLLCVVAGSSGAVPGDTIRVSVDSSGNQADEGPQGSYQASISSDGRYVAFTSSASDLVEGDTNGKSDIFVRDRDTDDDEVFDEAGVVSTERVSVSSSETQADGYSSTASISSDGRYVAFTSEARNLVPGDTGYRDVFVRDLQTGTTEEVTNTGGVDPNQAAPSISSDGRYVAFTSSASNVVEGDTDTNSTYDVFVYDRATGTTQRVSVDNSGNEANGVNGTISADGRYVAFTSSASSLVTGIASNGVFVRDLQRGTTEEVSVDSFGNEANDYSFWPAISADGRYVAFGSAASNLVTGDTNGASDSFVRDRTMGTTQRVNIDPCATQSNSGTYVPATISSDGRYVAFTSAFSNYGGGHYVRDLQTQTTQRVSGDGYASLSAEARYIAFDSSATDLVADDTNGKSDVFVHERQTQTTQPSECIPPTSTASATTSSGRYDAGTWTNKDVQVTLNAQDNEGGSGVRELTYSATGAQPIPRTTVPANQLPKALPLINTEGTTTISYFAVDNEGNPGSAKTFTVNIDKSAPDTSIVSGPSGYVSSTSVSFWVSKNSSEEGFQVSLQCSLDGSSFAGCPQFPSYSSLSQGNHIFRARTVDKAGNPDTTPAERSFTVDTIKPRVKRVVPTENATGITPGTNVSAFFSEAMRAGSINTNTVKLFKAGTTTTIGATVTYDAANKKAILNPNANLRRGVKYKAVVNTGVRDLAGNQLDQNSSVTGNQPKVWFFRIRN